MSYYFENSEKIWKYLVQMHVFMHGEAKIEPLQHLGLKCRSWVPTFGDFMANACVNPRFFIHFG